MWSSHHREISEQAHQHFSNPRTLINTLQFTTGSRVHVHAHATQCSQTSNDFILKLEDLLAVVFTNRHDSLCTVELIRRSVLGTSPLSTSAETPLPIPFAGPKERSVRAMQLFSFNTPTIHLIWINDSQPGDLDLRGGLEWKSSEGGWDSQMVLGKINKIFK